MLTCPTSREWFVWFKQGSCLHMGEVWKQNKALTTRILLSVLKEVEQDWVDAPSPSMQGELEEFASTLLISFGAALQGEEVTLVSLKGMLSTWVESTTASPYPCVMVTLHGGFKEETGLRWHCLPLAVDNYSKIPYKLWIGRLLR